MLAAKIPQRTICEQLHMGRGVLNRYKTLADSQGLSYGVIGRMNDGEIESFLQLSKPTSFWLLCFIPTFITKTPAIHYQDTHYSLTRRSLFTIYIAIFKLSHQLPSQNKEIFISHLTLLFST